MRLLNCLTIASLLITAVAQAQTWPPFPDANGDGRIDLVDANTLSIHFGYFVTGGAAEGDFNTSGTVDSSDFNYLVASYGSRKSGVSAPPYTKIELYAGWNRAIPWRLVSVPIPPAAIASDPQLANARCYDLEITTLTALTAAGLDVTLTSGSFYNHPSGYNTRLDQSYINATPALAYDTYIGSYRTTPYSFGGVSAIGRHPATVGAPILADTRLSAAWTEIGTEQRGTYAIARLTILGSTLPPDIPEPAALSSFVAIALAMRRRA